MHFFKNYQLIYMLLGLILFSSCKKVTPWKGQAPIRVVSTVSKPIQKQHVGTFDVGNGIHCSNDFKGARLNGIVLNDNLLTALIMPENAPINPSPWYAFKVWSDTKQDINLKISYLEGYTHRYYPNISQDGKTWKKVLQENYSEGELMGTEGERKRPKDITIKLSIGPAPIWIAAQELESSEQVFAWIDQMDDLTFVSTSEIGKSREGKPIRMLKIGQNDDQRMNMIISRQHPPEVTGYLAMKAFVETLCSDHETAQKFRSKYNTYVIPLANPDGVDHGHWRHNTGGIDLNRDWRAFNQPETSIIRDFMQNKVKTTGGKFYFAFDFHSTWEDIYYTINPIHKGNMPGLVPAMIQMMSDEIEGYEANIRPGPAELVPERLINSSTFFFSEFKAEALTYEIGDNTPRDLIKKKGEVSAMKLMEYMLENTLE